MKLIKNGRDLLIIPEDIFSLPQTLDCGQAFRWEKTEDNKWHGVVKDTPLTVYETADGIVFENTDEEKFNTIWKDYFDFDTDYEKIRESFSSDLYLSRAMDFCGGISLLKQEPWEALCSFIISQNNNIPRIKGIISRLCEAFGDNLGNGDFSFPDPQRLAQMEPEELAPIRAGFRAKYIVDAARKVASGEVPLYELEKLPLEEGLNSLMKITGVGPKVASCALLYGCGKKDAFPIDVWVKKILKELYPDGFPFEDSPYKGVVQQYLFHYRRFSPDFEDNKQEKTDA